MDAEFTIWQAVERWATDFSEDCAEFIDAFPDDIVSASIDDDGLTLTLLPDIDSGDFHRAADLQGMLDTAGVPVKLMGDVGRFYPKLPDVPDAAADGFGFGDVAIWDHLHGLLESFGDVQATLPRT